MPFWMGTLNIPKLSEDQTNMCEGKILPVECEVTLASFLSNKACGNNGIPDKFYEKL